MLNSIKLVILMTTILPRTRHLQIKLLLTRNLRVHKIYNSTISAVLFKVIYKVVMYNYLSILRTIVESMEIIYNSQIRGLLCILLLKMQKYITLYIYKIQMLLFGLIL